MLYRVNLPWTCLADEYDGYAVEEAPDELLDMLLNRLHNVSSGLLNEGQTISRGEGLAWAIDQIEAELD